LPSLGHIPAVIKNMLGSIVIRTLRIQRSRRAFMLLKPSVEARTHPARTEWAEEVGVYVIFLTILPGLVILHSYFNISRFYLE